VLEHGTVDSSALQRLPLEAMAGVPASGAGNKTAVDGCEKKKKKTLLQSKSHEPRQRVPHCVCSRFSTPLPLPALDGSREA